MSKIKINKEMLVVSASFIFLFFTLYFVFIIVNFNHRRMAIYNLETFREREVVQKVAGGVFITNSSSSIYYIDSLIGDDKYDGKSMSVIASSTGPWKTISKMVGRSFNTGDQILLNCDGLWRERIELKSNFAPSGQVKIGAYGDCANKYPTIKGTDLVAGPWVSDLTNSNLLVANLVSEPLMVFVNGARQMKARYPNHNGPNDTYNLTKIVNSNSSVVLGDDDKSFLADKDMVGAGYYMRVEPWWVHGTTVQSYDVSTATLIPTKDMPYTVEAGNGYVLEGKKWMLDTPGEWYYDNQEKKLYIYKTPNVNIDSANVEAAVRWNAIYLNGASNVDINHIKMGETRDKSLATLNSNNINIDDIIVSDDMTKNVEIMSSNNVSINNSKFKGAGYVGVDIGAGSNNSITNSTVRDHGMSSSPWPVQGAISVNSENVLVENNTIENVGYHGISFSNREGTRILNNKIKNFCIKLSDCGGIYTYNGSKSHNPIVGAILENNSVENAQINSHGSSVSFAGGVYLDNFTNNVTVRNNFISDVSSGIFLHEASDNKILNNKVWKTTRYTLGAGAASGDQYRNIISGNTFFATKYYVKGSTGAPTPIVNHASKWGNALPLNEILDKNTINNNKILTFNNSKEKLFGYNETYFDINEWNINGRSDVLTNNVESDMLRISTSGPNIITNNNMSGPLWSVYFENKTLGDYSTSSSSILCDGVCAKFRPGMGGDILVSNKFNMTSDRPNNLYYLRAEFAAGDTDTGGHVTIRRDATPYDNFGYSKALPIIKAGTKHVLEEVFAATNSDKAMLNIYGKVGSALYVDNVSLYKVDNVEYFEPYKYSAHLINNTTQAKSFSCADANLPSCNAYNDSGNKINWPATLSPYSSKIIMSDTGTWLAKERVSNNPIENTLPVSTSTSATTSQATNSTTTTIFNATNGVSTSTTNQNNNQASTSTQNNQVTDVRVLQTQVSITKTTPISTANSIKNTEAQVIVSPTQIKNNIKKDPNPVFTSERVLLTKSSPDTFKLNLGAEEVQDITADISNLNTQASILSKVKEYLISLSDIIFGNDKYKSPSSEALGSGFGISYDEAGEVGNFSITHKSGEEINNGGEINLGYLNNHKAGSKGHVYINNAHLYLEGARIRFYGINLFCGATMPNKTDAEIIAKRLKSEGFNAARLGCFLRKIDPNPNPGTTALASYRQQGILNTDNETFNDLALDQLDYFIYQLQENGIYIQLMLGDSYHPTAGHEDCFDSCRGVNMYLDDLIDSQKDMADKFLNHKNPYSNRYYYNDPGILATDYNNENSILTVWAQKTLDKYADKFELKNKYIDPLESKWLTWLMVKYENIETVNLRHGKTYASSSDIIVPLYRNVVSMNNLEFEDWVEFVSSIEYDYKNKFKNYLKNDLNVTSLVYSTQNNYDRNLNRSLDDVSDIHTYFGDLGTPTGEKSATGHSVLSIQNKSILSAAANIQSLSIPGIFENKEYGKPAFITETAYRGGNQYIGEFEPLLSAYAGFNDIDAIFIFSYKDNNLFNLNTVTAPWYNSTINSLTRPSSIISFRNGYVKSGAPEIVSQNKSSYLGSLTSFTTDKTKWVTSATNFHFGGNIRSQYTNNMYYKSIDGGETEKVVNSSNVNSDGAYITSSGEIAFKLGKYFKLNNNKIKSVFGFFDKEIIEIDDTLTVHIGDTINDYAIINLVSLDGKSITESERMLMTLGGYYEVEGEWPRLPGSNKYSLGTGPQKIESIPANVFLKLNNNIKVYALDSGGDKAKEVEVIKVGGVYNFKTGPKYDTDWYLIEKVVDAPVMSTSTTIINASNTSSSTTSAIYTAIVSTTTVNNISNNNQTSTNTTNNEVANVRILETQSSRPNTASPATSEISKNSQAQVATAPTQIKNLNKKEYNPTFASERVLLTKSGPETFEVNLKSVQNGNGNLVGVNMNVEVSKDVDKTVIYKSYQMLVAYIQKIIYGKE